MSQSRAVPATVPTGYIKTIAGIDLLGADILISTTAPFANDSAAMRYRHTSAEGSSYPRIEISQHGLRIGCTFITKDAIKSLSQELEKFEKSRTHVVQP